MDQTKDIIRILGSDHVPITMTLVIKRDKVALIEALVERTTSLGQMCWPQLATSVYKLKKPIVYKLKKPICYNKTNAEEFV